MGTEHHPVVVVGAGPTGMSAALLLMQYGIESLVIDRWDNVYPQPRAVHLDDEVYRILGDLDLAEGFAAISRPGRGLRLIDRDIATLAEFVRDPDCMVHGFPQANMFDQPDLERLMRRAIDSRGAVEMRGGCDVVDIANMRDHARITYLDVKTGERRFLTADHVLGCDGANSVVRSSIGSKMQDLGFEQRWLVVDIATDAKLDQWEGVHQVCDAERAATYMRIGPSRYRWEFRLHDHESAADYADLEAVEPLLRPWLGTATPELTVVRSTEYTFRAQVADRWRDRRVFLLGDAAHTTPPFIGQGMGAGLRDARNLAWKLAAAMSGASDSTLDTYQSERKPHVTTMIRMAVAIGWAMTGGGSVSDIVRKRVAPLLPRIPLVGAKVTDSASPPLSRSAYVLGGFRPRDLAGSLCPNAVTDNGMRLDDVATGRFLFVATTPLTQEQRAEVERRGAVVLEVPASSEIGEWLRHGRAVAAIVRPDRTVMATGRSVPALHTRVPALSLGTGGPSVR